MPWIFRQINYVNFPSINAKNVPGCAALHPRWQNTDGSGKRAKKRLMLLSATETLLYDDSLESRMTHRPVGSSPAGSVYHLYGAIWQCHQVLRKVVVHALSDLDAMCNKIIDRLPFQATWCCKCINKEVPPGTSVCGQSIRLNNGTPDEIFILQ